LRGERCGRCIGVTLLTYSVRLILRQLGNLLRRLRRAPDYVLFTLEGPYPEMAPPRGGFLKRRLTPRRPTLHDLRKQFMHVARDGRVIGIVLRLCSLKMSYAQLQSLRDLIAQVRAAGKRVIAWSHSYEFGRYYVACACDEILLQQTGSVTALGHGQRYVFLADALEKVGLKGDFIQISPYKTAPDMLTRREMSDEAREMADWLSDDIYGQVLEGIAAGRGIGKDAAAALVDGSPYHAPAAVEAGAVEAIVGEEELPVCLAKGAKPIRIAPYEKAKRRLLAPALRRPGKHIALLRIAGDIVDGRSAQPPVKPPFRIPLLFSERAGDLTVVRQARLLARDRKAAAVVVHVDSGGGSATSSEAMAAALRKVAEKKPVVVSMGSVAASGGYYVATPGQWIVAQPATITGSIGVLSGKIVTSGMLDKLLLHSEMISRGEHALFYSASRPFTEDERRRVWEMINQTYAVFLDRVSSSRDLSPEDVDAVGGGRVWTGRQALEHGLVDELGGLERAIQKACELAGLSSRSRVRVVGIPKRNLAPIAAKAGDAVRYLADGIEFLGCPTSLLVPTILPWPQQLL
jgi:protease-4